MIGLGGLVDTQGRVLNLMQDEGEFFIQAECNGPVVLRLSGEYAEKVADAIKAERALLARQAGRERVQTELTTLRPAVRMVPTKRGAKKPTRVKK